MEGAMFFWISWGYWIMLTFFMEKQNTERLKLSVAILILIILSPLHFFVFGFDLYASALFILMISYIGISKEKRGALIYFFICSFIITIASVTFHLFEIFDPVLLVFRKEWMMGICLSILSLLLQKTLKGRILIMLSGVMQGEILYAYILSKYPFPYSIGTLASLDVCLLVSLILTGWTILENASTHLAGIFKFTGKQKPKSS